MKAWGGGVLGALQVRRTGADPESGGVTFFFVFFVFTFAGRGCLLQDGLRGDPVHGR